MNILVLVESLNINRHSGAIVSSNMINAISSNDTNITVIYPELYGNPSKTDWLDVKKSIIFTIREKNSFEKIINNIPKFRAIPFFFTGYSFEQKRVIDSWVMTIKEILKRETFDLILVLGVGNVLLAHAAMSKISTKIPWIANIHDPYPQHHYPEPYAAKNKLLYFANFRAFDDILKKASYISFPSYRLMEWMSQYHPHIMDKSIILPHPRMNIDESYLPDSVNDSELLLDNDKFNLIHTGSLLGPRNPGSLLKAYKRFLSEDRERSENSVMTIVGSVSKEHDQVVKLYSGLPNLRIFTKRISYKHSLRLQKNANVLILLEAAARHSPFMPGKLSDYIMADRPIMALTPKNSETSRLLGKNHPYWSMPDDERKIYQVLVKLWERWKKDKDMKADREDLVYYISPENIKKSLKRDNP